MLRALSPRYVATALAAAILVSVVIAVPTAIIENPWFSRMTPVYGDQYAFWLGTSLLTGALLATYVGGPPIDGGARLGATGTVLAYLAVGCPVCNKAVVALLGVSGALDFFAPAQPLLGALGLLAAAAALAIRLRSLSRPSCEPRAVA